MSRTPAKFTQADVARAKIERKTFIYFMRAGEFIKIGHSRNWRSRMSDMQTGSPHTIVPLLVLIAAESDERKLHVRFRKSRFRGEWFHSSPAIQSYIKDNLSKCVAKSDLADLRIPDKWANDVWDDVVL